MKTARALNLLASLSVSVIACNTGSQNGHATSASDPGASRPAVAAPPAKPTPAPASPAVSDPCGRDFTEPALMQRAGRARIVLKGAAISVDAVRAPAICGPLYNTDVRPLGVHAGDGLQFEVCLPQGVLQISAETRAPGAQRVHTGQQPSGAETTFQERAGETYSARGASTDSIVFGPDLWTVDATLVLHAVDGDGRLAVQVSIDCSALVL